jgi:peptidyl-prolyl cis-trans isomerase SurA
MTQNMLSAQPARTLDKTVAVVDEYPIFLSELELQKEQLKEKMPLEDLDCKILKMMIQNKLFTAQAKSDSLIIKTEEIDYELERRIRYFTNVFGSKEKMEKHYGKSIGELKEDFREDVEQQMMAERIKSKITAGISPTPADVKAYFKTIPKDSLPYFNSEVQIAQIAIIPKPGKDQKRIARSKIEQIKKDIESNGMDFATQAILYSDDPGSAVNGGLLGTFNRGEMVPEFEAVAFKQDVNKVSDVVETKFGFHIIQTLEKKGEKVKARHILIMPKVSSIDVEMAHAKIDTIYAKLMDGRIAFEKAVGDFSDDENSKNTGGLMQNPANGTTYFEMSELDGGLSFAIDKIEVGKLAEPMIYSSHDGRSGYRILKLISQTDPHQASLEKDYTKMKNATLQFNQEKALEKWMSAKKNEFYIKIDKSYSKCGM